MKQQIAPEEVLHDKKILEKTPEKKIERKTNRIKTLPVKEEILEEITPEISIDEDEGIKETASDDGFDSQDKKEKKTVEAVVNIYTSFNNTIVHVTDMSGKTLTKVTGGMVTKHGRLKANPTIAMFIAKRVAENLHETGVGSLYFRIRAKTGNPAPGPGANAIIKSLSREGFKVLNILDTTRFPRGGPKRKGGRRGRRP
ncbi:30S ribosomal protein S11 [Candidatus Pacearchaeota archaeon]|nr:30S ribosomal protein S11 [Candidatus Pacearchaeota archaeon]